MFIVIKKSAAIIFCLCFILATACLAAGLNINKDERVIVIDAGHGAPDGGCVAPDGTCEAELNLSVSKLLKKELETYGYKVIMTRDNEDGIHKIEGSIKEKKRQDMNARAKMKKKGDLFVSIHMNMFPEEKYFAPQVLYDSTNEKSKLLADSIQESLNSISEDYKRVSMKASNIFLLKASDTPSVIVECGFLSNQKELELLKTPEHQAKLSKAVAKGIKLTVDTF